jgi:nucleotide-binding universal stress UspA family protein
MKFDHILFPIDFSERSRALNKQVEWLAQRFGSRVTLLHVFEIPASWYGAGEATFVNMECFDQLRDCEVQRLKDYTLNVPEDRIERIIAEGSVAPHITNWIKEHDVDLVVMATQGYGAIEGLILGSVTAKVLHNTQCPVWTDSLLHSPSNGKGILKILCAAEMTDEAVPLLRFTRRLAEDLGASVRLVHSVPEVATRPNRYFEFDLHRYLMEAARIEIAKLQREAGTDFPVTISGHDISDALATAAIEHGADLVVIGRGKTQKTFRRFQSHAYEIIRYAPCPVLSYPMSPQDHISSSCSVEHLSQFEGDGLLQTGSLKP